MDRFVMCIARFKVGWCYLLINGYLKNVNQHLDDGRYDDLKSPLHLVRTGLVASQMCLWATIQHNLCELNLGEKGQESNLSSFSFELVSIGHSLQKGAFGCADNCGLAKVKLKLNLAFVDTYCRSIVVMGHFISLKPFPLNAKYLIIEGFKESKSSKMPPTLFVRMRVLC